MYEKELLMIIYKPDVSSRCPLPIFLYAVSAGFPSPAEDFTENSLDLNDFIEHPASTFFVRAEGDSMIGAGIYDGDLLIVDRSLEAKHNSIVIASIHGDLTMKRLIKQGNKWLLKPENPDYPIMELEEQSQIWGVVKNCMRDLEK